MVIRSPKKKKKKKKKVWKQISVLMEAKFFEKKRSGASDH